VIVNPTWIKGRKKGSFWLQNQHCLSSCLFKTHKKIAGVVKPARFCRWPAPAPPRRRSASVTSSTYKTDPKYLPGPARPYCPRRTGIVQTPVPGPVDHRVTVAESLSPGRNSDNEKFASVVKLARFCSPDGLRRPCPTAALPPGRRVTVGADCAGRLRLPRPSRRPCPRAADFEQVAVNCQPEGRGHRRAGCRAVTRTQLGLPARRRTTAAVTAKARVASVAGCPSQGQCRCCSALQAGKT
jgi:hypothetical protein